MKKLFCLLLSIVSLITAQKLSAESVDSPHGNLIISCNACHSTGSWGILKPALDFNHDKQTSYPLLGKHLQTACIDCHTTLLFSKTGSQCLDCHKDIHSGQFSNACESCHTPQAWDNQEKLLRFHQQTRFPLAGVHAKLDCQACHAKGQYAGLSSECSSCHLQSFTSTANPAHVTAGFSSNCTECHNISTADWKQAKFTHTLAFPLTGGHAINSCNQCHSSGFANTSSACYSCHATDFNSTTNPNHTASNFSQNCQTCHNSSAWRPAGFDHNLSQFPLTGAHTQTACLQCHADNQYTGTPTNCYACHQANFENTTNPNHTASNFPQNCQVCHSTSGWQPASFDHNLSQFPLTGAHIQTACVQCHVNNQYTGTPTDCYTCHQANFENADNPNHVTNSFSHACVTCHTTAAWQPATFDHNLTDFPLTGAHVQTQCLQCHVGGNYTNTPTDCYTCHQANFDGATNPNHVTNNFSHTCVTCHSTAAWQPATFDHNLTDFPLTGAHVQTQCLQCHVGGNYNNTPTDCYTCHQANFESADNPNHLTNNFSHACLTCHSTAAWQPATFDHNLTDFPLTGAHAQTQCLQCHISGNYTNTPTDCYSCHQVNFDGATNPNHVTNNFSHACLTCHSTAAWQPATFDHNLTDFPLTGAHVQTQCLQCHVNGNYNNTPTECFACHETAFNNAPDHSSGQFPHNCTQCHGTTAWQPSTFNHNQTDFPLTGRHVQTLCSQCHVNGQFTNTPSECFYCHAQDYNGATNPNHQAAGFPTSCQDCHNTTNWNQAQFNHDQQWFPIYSGRHQGRWNTCSDCHTNPNNFTVFSCITCHEHNRQDTDNQHNDVGNYVYDSNACYSCHPTGGGGGGPPIHKKLIPNQRKR